MEELEWLNRQIEAVRNEVAVEQRRLSHYQSVRSDSKRTSETICKPVNGDSSRPSSLTGTEPHYCKSKYVVDNSKPRTDLEYDPLSNFSAGLRPLGKDQKAKAAQCVSKREVSSNYLNRLSTFETQPAVQPSPEQVDDYKEEGDLIIDIPPSPARKRSRAERCCDGITTKSQDAVIEVKKFKPAPTVLREAEDVDDKPCEDDTECLSDGSVYQQCRSEPSDAGVFDNLTKCLEDLRSKSQEVNSCSQDVDCVAESSWDVKPQGLPETSESSQGHHHQQLVINIEDIRKIDEERTPSPSLPRDAPVEASPPPPDLVMSSYTSCHRLPLQAQRAEQHPRCTAPNYNRHPMQSVTSVPSCGQKVSEQVLGAAPAFTSPENYVEGTTSTAAAGHALHVPPTSVQAKVTNGMEQIEQLSSEAAGPEIEVDSSLDELNYSDADLSDSDPMEECYRIFMEDSRGKGTTEQNNVPVPDTETEMPEVNLKNKVLPEKNGMSHIIAKDIEMTLIQQPVANGRPEPQMLVPLQQEPSGSGTTTTTQLFTASVTPQPQQSAVPTRSAYIMKGVQASTSSHQKPATVRPPLSQNTTTYMNCIPAGTAVIQVGNNLHFILPEGTFPLPIASLANAITPIAPVHHGYRLPPATLNPVQAAHRRTLTLTPLHASTSNPVSGGHTSSASQSVPHTAVHHTPAKPMAARRKMKQPPDVKEKVPHDVRQRYVNMFTEELLKTSPSVNDAFEKAVAEERSVYNRSTNKLKYLSVAVNALKRLKSQSTVSAKGENEAVQATQMSRGKVPLNVKADARNGDAALYDSLKEYVLTEERLIENNYPLQHPEKPGSVALFADKRGGTTDSFKKICSRCGATYSVNQTGKHTRKEECNYHNGKGVEKRGGVETRYSCCQAVIGAPGCQVFKLHVHDAVSLEGFVATRPREASDKSCPGVYSLNCEVCYTTGGLELSRVTVVNSGLQLIYDTFIRPENEVIDYNTRFSGISEDDMNGINTSISEVQETLLSFIHADTILIGHSLESDLCALKLIHGMVMDISVVFPHRLGPPNKLALNTLVADHLRRIIQDSVSSHDTAEDATACMELMLWKIKEDGKAKVKRF